MGVAAVVTAAVAIAGCGSSSSTTSESSPTYAAPSSAKLEGGLILNPPEAAPPLVLRNYTGGAPISLESMRGKAVFVTFVYTHCPNVCPLIVSGLAAAQRALGPAAARVRFVAVTVDPRRDTPVAVKAFLTTRGALGRMYYLLGTRDQLEPIWKAWHVTISFNQRVVTHSSVIYGISATGELKIVYPSNFNPAQIVHDASVLERS